MTTDVSVSDSLSAPTLPGPTAKVSAPALTPARYVAEDGDVFTFSASQVSTWRSCPRKWAYSYVLGLKSPPNASAALGTAIHSEMEAWLLKGAIPTKAPAKRLLPYSALPKHPGLSVEHAFRILFPCGAARGFIDVLNPFPVVAQLPDLSAYGPAFQADIPIVTDWKSTSNLDYAKSPEDLVTDPQAVLYGVEARRVAAKARGIAVKDVGQVDLLWAYTSTRAAATKPVRLRQSLSILEDGLGPVLEDVKQMGATKVLGLTVGEVPYDLRTCEAYGGCPFKAQCTAHLTYVTTGFAPVLPDQRNLGTENLSDTVSTKEAPVSELLAKLAAAKRSGPPSPPPKATAAVAAPAAKPAELFKPTPEPSLPVPDTSGLDAPLPAGSSPILPPDAAPNVTPDDPPVPEVVATGKGKPGRKPKISVADVEIVPAASDFEKDVIEVFLKRLAEQALRQNRLVLANQAISTLVVVQGGG